jgi:signal transduction histidine kinase
MDQLQTVLRRTKLSIFFGLLLQSSLIIGLAMAANSYHLSPLLVIAGLLLVAVIGSFTAAVQLSLLSLGPLTALRQVILHLSPDANGEAAPDLTKLRIGQELVTNLSGQLYQFASVVDQQATKQAAASSDLHRNFIANNLPLPLLVLDNQEVIQFANEFAANYIGSPTEDLIGKNVYMVMDMLFPNDDTFDVWLKEVKLHSATASTSWERVRLNVRDNHPTRLFDLAAYFNRDNPLKQETMLVLFDHTKQYSQDEQAVSFIALSVHELRTPLTLLRGYIEVFQEELNDTLDADLADFMNKMSATAQQLTAFVNNILNVARVDNDQLELKLQEGNWQQILSAAIDSISLRAQVRGITIEATIAPDLVPVAVDRISIHEVINNLIDNAIKYSDHSTTIKIDAHLTTDGMVETTVQDFGKGISSNVMANLFTKFYRDHRNRAQIGGTGLGLYLSKALVTAHGGQMWVRSTEGQGSTFGFTLLPYSQVAKQIESGEGDGITRGAHGWIKNHSLYRR